MLVHLHPKEALIVAARTAERPVAFMVGSPLSIDSQGGVPNVDTTIDLVRSVIQARAPTEISRFEDAVREKTGGDKYQVAMTWLNGNLGQTAVNLVVEKAVMQARKSPLKKDTDGEPGGLAHTSRNKESGKTRLSRPQILQRTNTDHQL